MLYVLYSIHAEKGNEILMIEDSRFKVQGSRFKVQRVQRVQVAASPHFRRGYSRIVSLPLEGKVPRRGG